LGKSSLGIVNAETATKCVDEVFVRVLRILWIVLPLTGPLGSSIVLQSANRRFTARAYREPRATIGGIEKRLDQSQSIRDRPERPAFERTKPGSLELRDDRRSDRIASAPRRIGGDDVEPTETTRTGDFQDPSRILFGGKSFAEIVCEDPDFLHRSLGRLVAGDLEKDRASENARVDGQVHW
jgi:hypothetical protein